MIAWKKFLCCCVWSGACVTASLAQPACVVITLVALSRPAASASPTSQPPVNPPKTPAKPACERIANHKPDSANTPHNTLHSW